MKDIADASVDLVVTSPPYPMVEMWDAAFAAANPEIEGALKAEDGARAFELMHQEVDKVWQECFRVLKPGGTMCINIGDAVRTLSGNFQMYSNHVRIVNIMLSLGMTQLPDILWRKPTNSPNKFMGSGMLPVGAYVTYEHEYILIFRKGSRRVFQTPDEKQNRRASAFFWEERNSWFSDLWSDLKGTTQGLTDTTSRQRSGAYPFELAYRLICMYSVYGDTVLDPFLGTGTTVAAAIATCRNSIGIEIEHGLQEAIKQTIHNSLTVGAKRVTTRLAEHQKFMNLQGQAGLAVKYLNCCYDFPVITSQETDILFYLPVHLVELSSNIFCIEYELANSPLCEEPRNGNEMLVKSSCHNA